MNVPMLAFFAIIFTIIYRRAHPDLPLTPSTTRHMFLRKEHIKI